MKNNLHFAPQKRNDIQILRSYSVLTVLLYHLRPKWIPNGFLAVDIFFVISGYLMAKILQFGSLEASISRTGTLHFYKRRFKRLIPTYIFVILMTAFVGGNFLIPVDFKGLSQDALWALGFASNIQTIMKKEDYFKMTSEFAFLLHSWSLSVEAQYYLLCPVLFALLSVKWPLCGLILTTIVSFLFQIFAVSDIVAFNFLFCRIWQFLIGAIVYYCGERRIGIKAAPCKLIAARLILMGCTLTPRRFDNPAFARTLATVSTGFAIYAGKFNTPWIDTGFWVRPAVFIGDASYSIYLTHWPTIVFIKYFQAFDSISLDKLIIIIFTFSLAIYFIIEKPVGNFRSTKLVFFTAVFYILTILICKFQYVFTSLQPTVLENDRISQQCDQVPESAICNWDPEMLEIYPNSTKSASFACSYSGHGNATVFVTGNSFALRQVNAVRAALQGNYKTLYFVARPGCITFDRYNKNMGAFFKCHEVHGKVSAFLKKFRPDVLIITQLMSFRLHPLHLLRPKTEKDADTVRNVEQYLHDFMNYTKAIVHIEPHHRFWYSPPLAVARHLAIGQPLDSLYMTESNYNATVHPTWNIVLKAMKSCPICRPINIRQVFCANGKCPAYDEETELSLFCDGAHLSVTGIERMVAPVKEVLDKVIKDISNV